MAKFIKNFSTQFLILLALELCKYLKISFALMTGGIFFSLTQVLMPVIGLYRNKQFNIAIYIIRTASRIFLLGFSPLIIFYHLPTFCGNAYLAHKSIYAKIGIPLLCMIMFIFHPVGNQAFLYSMYWLIPITIAIFKSESIFLQALGSTFTVHSVGSIIWLYTKQIDPGLWNMLLPIVIIERLVLASLTTIIFYITKSVKNLNLQSSIVAKPLESIS